MGRIITVNKDFEKLWGITEREFYSKQYLTFEALEDGVISFNIWYAADTDVIKSISYSLDDGETWTKTENVDDKEENLVIDVDVNSGDKILWKGDAIKTSCFDDNEGEDIGSFFSSDSEFNAYGNIMSLLYEDDFEDKNTLNNDYTFSNLFYDYNATNECLIVSAKNLILPATTLVTGCYYRMFSDCTSLIKAPELPAATLAEYCYQEMFSNCTSLIKAPELPATTLTEVCYNDMFLRCTSLIKAPELPATTLTRNCYNSMFTDCSSLNYIKMLATDISARFCLSYWTDGVAETGTLIINKDYEGLRSDLNVPYTWTILNEDGTPHIFPRDYSEEYLTFECIDNDGGNFEFNIPLDGISLPITSVSYSLDNGQNWTTYENEDDDINISLNLSAGDKILLKGIAIEYSSVHLNYDSPDEGYSNIHLLGDWSIYGNIMSLFYGDNFVGKTSFPKYGTSNSSYNCAGLFYQNDECNMGDLSNLILPATTLTQHCYYMMFADCPDVITKAPVLPATTLVSNCYTNMFTGCSALNYVKAMFTTTPGVNYTGNWLHGVAATGTFIKNKNATWTTTGASGVPSGWTVETV